MLQNTNSWISFRFFHTGRSNPSECSQLRMPVEFCSLCSEYQSWKVCTRIKSSTYDRYFSHYISSKLKRRFSQVQLCNLEIVGERPKKFRLRLDTTNIQPSHGATCWVLNFPGFVLPPRKLAVWDGECFTVRELASLARSSKLRIFQSQRRSWNNFFFKSTSFLYKNI